MSDSLLIPLPHPLFLCSIENWFQGGIIVPMFVVSLCFLGLIVNAWLSSQKIDKAAQNRLMKSKDSTSSTSASGLDEPLMEMGEKIPERYQV